MVLPIVGLVLNFLSLMILSYRASIAESPKEGFTCGVWCVLNILCIVWDISIISA